ncbi:alpha/beta fold hydrolase [Kribbella kalugense]|uniref:Pimeloyl-ACP methyl ester carboxylesterase n=1 Tax=Kribbella kalugense TaxID=2512221 RepID=A0A4R7ZTX0_9ACTN|nr:alpha/beta hydrolase [Kribbella kalugense]TDW18980.1 pimeloyl-ACP methyl ester carboxylesterase [Kribbella kalugense]
MQEGASDGRTRVVATPDGRRLGVCVWGDPGGAPVFWLHGTPGSRLLREPGASYADNHLRVFTYDRPGYGLSTRVRGRRVVDVAFDVRTIADAFGLEQFGVAGVSGGASATLAAAALLPDRVSRCAIVVGPAPVSAEGLDFYGGMDEESRAGWRHAIQGEVSLETDWQAMKDWLDDGMPGLEVSAGDRVMLAEAFGESTRQGSAGYVDDFLSLAGDWGLSLAAVQVPTRIMVARDDTSVPVAHGEWFARHLPRSELVYVDGGHFGPRDEAEEQLMTWVGHGKTSI